MPERGPYASPVQIERRLRILRVTLELLESEGLSNVTIKRVAERASVSLKTIHNNYSSRNELIAKAIAIKITSLQINDHVTGEAPGIPHLISFTEAVMQQFREAPTFMATVLEIIFTSDDDHAMSLTRTRHIREVASRSIQAAQASGELRPSTDIKVLTDSIVGNQWGAAFLFSRKLLTVDQFSRQTLVGHCVSLIPFTLGDRKRWLEAKLDELLSRSEASDGEHAEVNQFLKQK